MISLLSIASLSSFNSSKIKLYLSCTILSLGNSEAVALHDCDILTYDRSLLARLVYPVANPKFNFDFCKGYYPRVSEGKVKGRVARLLVTPLLRALEKTIGNNEFISFVDSFRYPLAGEFSFRRRVLKDIRIPYDWGLEIGVLSEMFRNYASNRICQADIASNNDHKNKEISLNNILKRLLKLIGKKRLLIPIPLVVAQVSAIFFQFLANCNALHIG